MKEITNKEYELFQQYKNTPISISTQPEESKKTLTDEEWERFQLATGLTNPNQTPAKPVPQGAGLNFWEKRRMNKNPSSSYLISMIHGNNTITHFVITTIEATFHYRKKLYHLDKEQGFYDINHHATALIYYEDYCEPILREFHIEGNKAFLAIKPDNLEVLLRQEYVKVLAQSQELSKWLKIAVFLMIIVAIMVLILVVIAIAPALRGIMPG